MSKEINVEQLLELQRKQQLVPIDVRSPSEYAEGTIPGSLNFPLFDDEERAEIGTLYKQESRQAAMDRGLEIVSAKLPQLIRSISQVDGQKAVFCWRGGMRSKTTATMLSLMGIEALRLTGGIREYRRWVVETLEGFVLKPQVIVLNGHTGTGKTDILLELKKRGFPVLDLEGMAGHRGSIFGQIGLQARNQKQFDAMLVHELLALNEQPYILLEGESRRIGKVVLPEFLMEKKESGLHLVLELPVEERVQSILQEYQPWKHTEEIREAFRRIKSRIHTPVAKEIEECLNAEHFERAVHLLLVHYYDPRYQHAGDQYMQAPIHMQAPNKEQALERLIGQLEKVGMRGNG
ncbi:tRNA 2-selenouridine(34) synthase MnmH [Xylanibacillus composti]|uniref:tRNA 2-selenouridine synthase n=1 Tax=Xylanibacillus composti TaxID=1572762 RepID=A0A8J4M0L0_9BACL|nr:tRNA 2-selenouridine(34) synthase MnmH [Xylanibacillus composti]MDT9726812.1 tRNA 2-selenouridine(34) synthase MnmH [Xylanibacillus composti]GIQ67205.1 tRNA 2-selenouridine synthase [Xylanibacillus composti]